MGHNGCVGTVVIISFATDMIEVEDLRERKDPLTAAILAVLEPIQYDVPQGWSLSVRILDDELVALDFLPNKDGVGHWLCFDVRVFTAWPFMQEHFREKWESMLKKLK